MSEPTEMVLRVAKALDFRSAALAPLEYPGDPARLRAMARMAIRAMKEPTMDMAKAAVLRGDFVSSPNKAVWVWYAMISSALGEE